MIKKLRLPFMVAMSIIVLIGQSGCIPQTTPQNIVITEDVIYISGEVVRLTGRVVETDGNVDDHGFYIAKDTEFTSPITISLGPKTNGLGRFIGEYALLDISTNYYFRSYANIGGQEVTGQIEEFKSLKPRIDSFSPKNGIQGTLVTITGINFTNNLSVSVAGVEVEIVSITDESSIQIRVPPLSDTPEVKISVVVQDTTMIFENNFVYHFGVWELETVFLNNVQLYECMFFKSDNQFVFGLGFDNEHNLNPDIWGLDLSSRVWSDLNFPGNSVTRLPFNSNGLWGGGAEVLRDEIFSPFFWQYSTGTFILKPFLPFRLYKSIGLHLNGQLYVFGGLLSDGSPNRLVHQYDEQSISWTTVDESPMELSSEYPFFVHNNEAYFVLTDGIWRFSPTTLKWTIVGNYPIGVKIGGGAVNINGKVYLGLFINSSRMFEWDIVNNTWTEKTVFPGGIEDINIGYFAFNDKPYFFRSKPDGGEFEQDPKMELWSLNPTALK